MNKYKNVTGSVDVVAEPVQVNFTCIDYENTADTSRFVFSSVYLLPVNCPAIHIDNNGPFGFLMTKYMEEQLEDIMRKKLQTEKDGALAPIFDEIIKPWKP